MEYRMSQMEGSSKLANIGEASDTLEKLKRRSRFTLFIAWIALFFTVIGIAAGYKNWMRINERAKAATHGVKALQEQVSQYASKSSVVAFNKKLLEELEQNREKISQSVEKINNERAVSKHTAALLEKQANLLTQAQEKSSLSPQIPSIAWRIAELKYLLKTADQRLQLYKDKTGALNALKTAEDTLLKIGDRKYLPVRKKLAEEIVALEAFLVPNIGAITQGINDLIKVIEALPVADEIKGSEKVQLFSTTTKENPSFLEKLASKVNETVVIHKFDESVQKTLGIDEKEKLNNLLHLRLETLRLMVLQGLDKNYHQQLDLIKQTLKKYYPDMINHSLLKDFQALEKVKLSPTPPDISNSLKLLEQISAANNQAKKSQIK